MPAAGGVGLILGQWAKHLGATTIGTAGSPDKVELARAHGYDHVINYREQDFVAEVKRITGGKLCDVVYDSVGKDTYPGSLDCTAARMGMFACFGQSSGPIPPFDLSILAQKGSLFATRPTLFVYIAKREDLEASAAALFDVVSVRHGQDRDQPALCAEGRGQGACRPGKPQDIRHDHSDPVSNPAGSC